MKKSIPDNPGLRELSHSGGFLFLISVASTLLTDALIFGTVAVVAASIIGSFEQGYEDGKS